MMVYKIKAELKRRGLKQSEVAHALGLSTSRVSRILSGKLRMRGWERREICAFLGVPHSALFPRYHRPRRARGDQSQDAAEK